MNLATEQSKQGVRHCWVRVIFPLAYEHIGEDLLQYYVMETKHRGLVADGVELVMDFREYLCRQPIEDHGYSEFSTVVPVEPTNNKCLERKDEIERLLVLLSSIRFQEDVNKIRVKGSFSNPIRLDQSNWCLKEAKMSNNSEVLRAYEDATIMAREVQPIYLIPDYLITFVVSFLVYGDIGYTRILMNSNLGDPEDINCFPFLLIREGKASLHVKFYGTTSQADITKRAWPIIKLLKTRLGEWQNKPGKKISLEDCRRLNGIEKDLGSLSLGADEVLGEAAEDITSEEETKRTNRIRKRVERAPKINLKTPTLS